MKLKTPYYIVYEDRLRANLDLITSVMRETDVKIIMAFKANALWRSFPIFREYGIESTASSVNEMLLANDELHCLAHTYCPAYTDDTIEIFIKGSSHITFNSVAQYQRFKDRVGAANHPISCGLRIDQISKMTELAADCVRSFWSDSRCSYRSPRGHRGFPFPCFVRIYQL